MNMSEFGLVAVPTARVREAVAFAREWIPKRADELVAKAVAEFNEYYCRKTFFRRKGRLPLTREQIIDRIRKNREYPIFWSDYEPDEYFENDRKKLEKLAALTSGIGVETVYLTATAMEFIVSIEELKEKYNAAVRRHEAPPSS